MRIHAATLLVLCAMFAAAGCTGRDPAPSARWLETLLAERHYDRYDEFFAQDARVNGSSFAKEYLVSTVDGLHRAFPDLSVEVLEQITSQDRIVTRFAVHGTNDGPFNTQAATGRAVRFHGVAIDTLRNGKVSETWLHLDLWSMAQQLGAGEPPRAGS